MSEDGERFERVGIGLVIERKGARFVAVELGKSLVHRLGDVVEPKNLKDPAVWSRFPSYQPEKVEPRVGQVWRQRIGNKERDFTIVAHDGTYWKSMTDGDDRVWRWLTPTFHDNSIGTWTLISTGEAEKPAACDHAGKGRYRVSVDGQPPGPSTCMACCKETGEPWVVDVKQDQYNHRKQDEMHAALMQAKNDAFHDAQAAAIKARWLEEQKTPYQPHWQRTGSVSTYSRRVPR